MCNCNFVPMMMCCNCGGNNNTGNNNAGGGGSTGFKETILYDGIINAVGTYTLNDIIDNYNDLFIVHEQNTGLFRQCLTIPVSCLGKSQMVCHGDGAGSVYIAFNITDSHLNIETVTDTYRIVKIIGRKY